ncbi:MAG: M14 family zinc carboxypeptidase [Candidatus Limnocylindrales bacterium]
MRILSRALLAATLLLPAGALGASAAEPEFPAADTGYHTYPEMAAEVAQAVADHPAIVRRLSIGKSHQGRDLWAVKISDHVATDEAEPEVLFDGLHHGDEHMSLEMTLAILRWLTDGYDAGDATIRELVDTREIWIVFAVNPDGATYDIAGSGTYRNWRKNRQPTSGSNSIGTDLNRNYAYRWGCCGGSSATPSSSRFRGRSALSAPETRAMTAFVKSRVVGGRQQIRAAISFHTTGRLVMYPFGYTLTNTPRDMTRDDRAVFVELARRMAATNGYRAIQASDLYISSGTSRDWLYGAYRTFAFTIEMSPDSTPFPTDEKIPSETGRNRAAVLDIIALADCPFDAIGKGAARCGAFDDDFEVTRGWRRDAQGTDTATGGRWQRADPVATSAAGPKQPGTTPSGIRGLVTGAAAGTSAGANDLDGGTTSVTSPAITLPPGAGQRLKLRYVFAHSAASGPSDWFRVEVLDSGGSPTTVLHVPGAPRDRDAAWSSLSIPMDAWAGQTIRLRLSARDGGAGNLVEASVDDVRITRP